MFFLWMLTCVYFRLPELYCFATKGECCTGI